MDNQLRKLGSRIDLLQSDMEARFNDIDLQFNGMEARIEEVNVQMNMLSILQNASEYNARARDQNSLVTSKEMYLCPLRNVNTNDDVRCPRTLAELDNYRGSELDTLLQDLGEPVPQSLKDKREIVKWAMGVRTGQYA
ncbi:hypothetical protein V8C37DRAFT_398993 [Trichoderma ceciliae]